MTFEIVPLFTTLLTLSLKAAVLVAAILFVRKLIGGRLSPAWRHALWGLVPLQLLFCVSVPSPWSVQNLWTENTEQINISEPRPSGSGSPAYATEQLEFAITPEFATQSEPRPSGTGSPARKRFLTGAAPIHFCIAVWFVGCTVMALVFLRQTLLCRRWMREAELVENEDVLRLFKECAKRMKVRTWLVVTESRSVSGPLLIGAIRPTLLLPHGLVESATPRQLRTVLLHELAHLKRWDVWTGWLMTLLLTLHWFNPLLWLAVRKMNADREEAADELALRTMETDERPDYGRALIDIAQHFVTPTRTPGLVGISETGKNLTRRIEMLTHTGTWKLRWKILALLAVLVLGVTTLTDAQTPKRSPAEIQAEIDRLQAELKEAETKEPKVQPSKVVRRNFRVDVAQDSLQVDGKKMTLPELVRLLKDEKNETMKTVVLTLDSKANYGDLLKVLENLTSQGIENLQFTMRKNGQDALPGSYLGTEGDDRFGIVIGEAKNGPSGNTYPVTMYEDGLPGKGYDPNDDDRYEGTARIPKYGKLEIKLTKKFDGTKEKPVEDVLKQFTANFELSREEGAPIITMTRNGEWDAVRVVKEMPPHLLRPYTAPTNTALPGSYLGWEGDDRFGIVIGQHKDGIFPVTMYEDGLPGKGFNPNDDDRYEGTATLKDGKLEIRLAKKFDENVEEPVEKALRKLTATLGSENGKTTLSIPKNREWDAVKVMKVTE